MSTKTDGLMNEEHWQRVRAAQVTQPSQTDDLEAKASEAIDRIREIAGTRIASDLPMMDPAITEIRALSGRVQHFFTLRARSLAQPPSSEEDGHPGYRAVLIAALKMETPDIQRLIKDCSMVVPKDPAPTEEMIIEAITEVLQDSYRDDVLDWIERSAYRDRDSGITQRIEAKLMNP